MKLFVRSTGLSDDDAFARDVRESVRRWFGTRVDDAGTLSVLVTDAPREPTTEKRCSVHLVAHGVDIRVSAVSDDPRFAADLAIARAADLLASETRTTARVA